MLLPALASVLAFLVAAPELAVSSKGEDVRIGGTSLRKITPTSPLELDVTEAAAGDELVLDLVRLSAQRGSSGVSRLAVWIGPDSSTISVRGAVVDDRQVGALYASRVVRHRVPLPVGASHISLRTDAAEGVAVGVTTSTPTASKLPLIPIAPRGQAPVVAPVPLAPEGAAPDALAPNHPPPIVDDKKKPKRPAKPQPTAQAPIEGPTSEPAPEEEPTVVADAELEEVPAAPAAAPLPPMPAAPPAVPTAPVRGPVRLVAQAHVLLMAPLSRDIGPVAPGGGFRVLFGAHDLRMPLAEAIGPVAGIAVDFDYQSAAGGALPRTVHWDVTTTRVRLEGAVTAWKIGAGMFEAEVGAAIGAGVAIGMHTIVVGKARQTPLTIGVALRAQPDIAVRAGPGFVVVGVPVDVVLEVVGDVQGRAPVAAGGLVGYRLDL
jgi:hypothetical protein